MKRFLPLLFCILLTHSLSSQTADSSSFRPRVGIALSGGGAKGAAHIGVLKYLEEIGIPIDRVAGTSMGSIIGGLYALGYTPDELAVLIANMDWPLYMSNNVERTYQSSLWREHKSTYLFSVPFGTGNFEEKSYSLLSTLPSGVINGASLSNLFSRLSIGYNDSTVFDRLPIPFVCVATDILNGDSVLLRSGNFAKAIRSSMAIPGVFSPVEWNGHLLADGGLVNNFPVDQSLAIGADIVIGVEVADELARTPEQMRSLPQQLSQYLSIAVNGNRSQNRELCDIYLHPNISGYNMLSFSPRSIDTLVQRGYDCAKAHHDELMALKHRLEQFGPCHKQLQAPRAKCLTPNDTFLLSSIVYRGITPDEERWFNQRDGLTLGTPVTIDDIERAVGIFIGTGAYTNVTYNLTKTGEDYWLTHHVYTDALGFDSYNLTVNLQQTEPHLLSLGFRYDSEESASLLLHLGWNEQRLTGFKAGLDLDLTYNVRFAAKASYDGLSLGDINLAYNYHNSSFSLLNYDSITSAGWRVNHHTISLFLSEFLMRDVSFAFGINEEFFSNHTAFSLNNMINSGIFHFDYAKGFLGLFVKGRYDNLDNAYFATRGLYLDADATWRNDNKKLFVTADSSFFDIGIDFQRFFSPSSRLTLIPQFSTRLLLGNASGWFDNMVGGALPGRYLDQQMAFVGFTSPLHVAPLAAILRFDARYRIGSRYYLYIMANEVFSTTSFLHIDTDLYTTLGLALRLAYDSPIGPVAVDLQWNDFTHRVGAYLNIGFAF